MRWFSAWMIAALAVLSTAHADDSDQKQAGGETSSQLIDEQPITSGDRGHWSFGPLSIDAVPSMTVAADEVPLASTVDALAAERMKRAGLGFAPQADRRALLRRVSFDLTGLPPSPEALERFCGSTEPDAWERELDRLLASPSYGEHMAQSWLDLARFAETDGFEHDKIRPDAWRYRDWVISAFNEGMTYDRFVGLQLAGDRASDAASISDANKIATMFCLSGPDMPDINDQTERRHNLMNEMTATVGSVFFGLQFGCAQCHDHKVDPISQGDFYRLRAALESGVPELKRDKQVTVLAASKLPSPARLYRRGDFRFPGPEVAAALPRLLELDADKSIALREDDPRSDLAARMFSSSNALTARTMANRIWQRHFGVGLAATSGDLGLTGTEPAHPELLEWTAAELSRDWDMKRLDRLIVLSRFYRQASYLPADAPSTAAERWKKSIEIDPENRLLSRYPRRRLTGEMLRDAMLTAADELNREAFGPGVMPPLPDEILSTLLPGQWKVSERIADHHRRSIYIFARRNLRYPLFETFDRPDAGASCPVRDRSTTALQSLTLMNSAFSVEMTAAIVDRVRSNDSTPAEQIDRLVARVLSRPASAEERDRLLKFLQAASGDSTDRLQAAALALINSNEFAVLD
ncbi:MAG: DUF1549 and DUF1553 domain-containing protein [Pirellulales bacterium]